MAGGRRRRHRAAGGRLLPPPVRHANPSSAGAVSGLIELRTVLRRLSGRRAQAPPPPTYPETALVRVPALGGRPPSSFRMYTRDGADQIARDLFRFGWQGFERPVPDVFARCVAATPGVVVDVGANTGFYSLVAVSASPSAARVHAFEPYPAAQVCLGENLALNRGALGRIEVFSDAVSDREGEDVLYVPDPGHGLVETSCSLNRDFKERVVDELPVRVVTLDAHREAHGRPVVSVLKIDVESLEHRVLAGAEDTLADDRPIVFLEVLPSGDPAAIELIRRRHRYVAVRLRADSAVVDTPVAYDPKGWNQALVPEEKLDVMRQVLSEASLPGARAAPSERGTGARAAPSERGTGARAAPSSGEPGPERPRQSGEPERPCYPTGHPRRLRPLVRDVRELGSGHASLRAPPDEHTHVIRATSVLRGEILGRETTTAAVTEVKAPALYGLLGERVTCFAFKPEVTPGCMGAFDGPHRFVPTHTYVGRYDPVYYGMVGIPSRLGTGAAGVYAMRMVSAGISAALVTLAVLAALRAARPSLALVGVAFALTPMVLFLGGSVNPNGMEITAAICLWSAGLLALDTRTRQTPLIVFATIGAAAMVVARGLSPFWLACILALMAVAAVRRPRRTLLGDRRMVVAGAVIVATAVAAVAWLGLANGLAVLPIGEKVGGPYPGLPSRYPGSRPASTGGDEIGRSQYFDANMPFLPTPRLVFGVGALVILAVVAGARRAWMAVVVCLGFNRLSPLVELPSVRSTGLIWQGRYTLPLAVGIPILAGYALSGIVDDLAALFRRIAVLLTGAVGLALVAAFYWAGRRNAVGSKGPFVYFGREEWHTPIPSWLLMLAFTGAVAGLVALFWRLTRREQEAESVPTAGAGKRSGRLSGLRTALLGVGSGQTTSLASRAMRHHPPPHSGQLKARRHVCRKILVFRLYVSCRGSWWLSRPSVTPCPRR